MLKKDAVLISKFWKYDEELLHVCNNADNYVGDIIEHKTSGGSSCHSERHFYQMQD